MSQFDLFAEPVAPTPEVPAAIRPAVIKEGTAPPENSRGLKPLRTINADWLEVKITDTEFEAEMAKHSGVSDQYVMLAMLAARGIMTKPCSDLNLDYLYEYVGAPYIIRKRTVPGFAITCQQGPKQETKNG